MQKIRLWEIAHNREPVEIENSPISLERQLEDWLARDISILDADLLVIGKQVRTDSGGAIDLLCLNSAGDTVVVELKRGMTPREVTAQALDYASWVKGLSSRELMEKATEYFKNPDSLASEFQNRFGVELPDELNLGHRALVVAEEIDAVTERIIHYLSDLGMPINVATVQHFKDKDGREMLAQVYLIEPEVVEAKAQSKSKRTSPNTLTGLQQMADENGIGQLYSRIREGVRGVLFAQVLTKRNVGYAVRLNGGSIRTVLIIPAVPDEDGTGLSFTAHASRFEEHLGVNLAELESWLPQSARTHGVQGWSGSSPEEKENALGLTGSFQNVEEVERFLTGLRSRNQIQE